MRDQLVGFLERTLIQKEFDSLPRSHLAFFVLLFEASRSPAFVRELAPPLEFRDFLFKFSWRVDYMRMEGLEREMGPRAARRSPSLFKRNIGKCAKHPIRRLS